jgi:hypothetical protein
MVGSDMSGKQIAYRDARGLPRVWVDRDVRMKLPCVLRCSVVRAEALSARMMGGTMMMGMESDLELGRRELEALLGLAHSDQRGEPVALSERLASVATRLEALLPPATLAATQ